jgi:hypothetical protein
MKILKCALCKGEVDILSNDTAINRKIKCRKCGFTNHSEHKEPEVLIIRKRPLRADE